MMHSNSNFSHAPHKHLRPSELEPERIVVFKKGMTIDYIYYICEISYNKRGYFISLFSIQNLNQKMVLHLPNSEKNDRILESYGYDYQEIADSLTIE